MSALSAFKKKLRTMRENKTQAVPPSTITFKIDQGWENLLRDKTLLSYKQGLHHQYVGIRLNPSILEESLVFACRDMITSYMFSRRAEQSQDTLAATYIIDLFSDAASLRHSGIQQTEIYKYLKASLPDLSSLYTLDQDMINKIIENEVNTTHLKFKGKADIDELLVKCKAKVTADVLTDGEIDKVILLYSLILRYTNGRLEFEYAVCMFLLSVAKTGSVSQKHMDKRLSGFRMSLNFSSSLIPKMPEGACRLVWNSISDVLKTGHLTTDILMNNIYKIVASIDNMLVTPLADQIAFRNQTAIAIICRAICDLPEFPWPALYESHGAIRSEFSELIEYLGLIKGDQFIGLVLAGCSKAFPNLSYLCYQLSIKALGNTTLANYKGTGSSGEGVNKPYFDNLIKDYMDDQSRIMGVYDHLKSQVVDSVPFSAMMKRISTFFLSKKKDDDDDPDSGPGPSGGSAIQDTRDVTDTGADETRQHHDDQTAMETDETELFPEPSTAKRMATDFLSMDVARLVKKKSHDTKGSDADSQSSEITELEDKSPIKLKYTKGGIQYLSVGQHKMPLGKLKKLSEMTNEALESSCTDYAEILQNTPTTTISHCYARTTLNDVGKYHVIPVSLCKGDMVVPLAGARKTTLIKYMIETRIIGQVSIAFISFLQANDPLADKVEWTNPDNVKAYLNSDHVVSFVPLPLLDISSVTVTPPIEISPILKSKK